ncbi:aspartic-type endopeptidase [Aureococcus anophagefferens]|nr:aspartic-type endopeptidase [Aureococcus anophagefferens]
MDRADANQPILFEGCIPDGVGLTDQIREEKRWTLVAPRHFKHFQHRWSGNAEMMLRETTPAPRLEITQRRGDVLFVPPWWIHETRVAPGTKNFGMNIHWMSKGQVLAELTFATTTLGAAPASFGVALPTSKGSALRLTLRWAGGLADGCAPEVDKWSDVASVAHDGFGLLAARSPNCTFVDRAAAAAKAGVRALVVYNTVEGIYRNRSYAEDKYDYDCGNGRGAVDASSYASNDAYKEDRLAGFPGSSCATGSSCESGRCLLTGNGGEVCCAWDTYMTMAATRRRPVAIDGGDDDDAPEFELTPAHAVGFICVASGALLVLFYVDMYFVVICAFALSSASSTTAVLWRPLLGRIRSCARRELFESRHFGAVSLLDVASAGLGVSCSLWWLAARRASYAWVLQDTFGMCLCVLFLNVIKLNSLRVAAMLLSMAFCYDIFFVFLSPYFEESIMVKVATGKGPSKDADYCEKYPADDDCQSTQLPMLLMLPRFGEVGGGYTMLGLGDIVLPGLLVSFAARYDAAAAAAHGTRLPK